MCYNEIHQSALYRGIGSFPKETSYTSGQAKLLLWYRASFIDFEG
jgi:hypothetical protein